MTPSIVALSNTTHRSAWGLALIRTLRCVMLENCVVPELFGGVIVLPPYVALPANGLYGSVSMAGNSTGFGRVGIFEARSRLKLFEPAIVFVSVYMSTSRPAWVNDTVPEIVALLFMTNVGVTVESISMLPRLESPTPTIRELPSSVTGPRAAMP